MRYGGNKASQPESHECARSSPGSRWKRAISPVMTATKRKQSTPIGTVSAMPSAIIVDVLRIHEGLASLLQWQI